MRTVTAQQILAEAARHVDQVHDAAHAAFAAGADWVAVFRAVAEARRATTRQAAREPRPVAGCPSEVAYRWHLRAGEECATCRPHMRQVEAARRARHPEWDDNARARKENR
jgi:hypothetical protein